jgi:hypothetical protein
LPLADLLPGRKQLHSCSLGEGIGPHRYEDLVGGAQLEARINAPVLPAKPFAVEQMGARELRTQRRAR